jgi:mannose-6-phosphate isomerase-like protein (cupin superfamily)
MTPSLACADCGEVVTAENEDTLVAGIQAHARLHGGEISRDYILAHLAGTEVDKGSWRLITESSAEALWFNGALMVIRADGTMTSGKLSIIDKTENAGRFTPLHKGTTDQVFFVLAGTMEFVIGDDLVTVPANATMMLRAGTVFAHRCAATPTRCLLINSPAGIEPFFRAGGERAPSHSVPPGSHPRPDVQALAAAAPWGGVEIVGPPPAI